MKTQVIHLDRHDDVASVKDKIEWSKSERILLVWPHRGRYLDRQLDLVRIYRHIKQMGARMALVARKPHIVHHAGKLGVPVFRSVREAQRIPWESAPALDLKSPSVPKRKHTLDELQKDNKKTFVKPANQTLRYLFFILGAISFLAVLLLFLPSATITLTPKIEIQELEFEVTASTSFNQTNLSGNVPAQIYQIIVEGQDTLVPGGRIEIPQEPATGMIELTNLTDREIYVPSGTTVRTRTEPSIRFHTLETATLPAEAGATIELAIEADNPGSAANLPEGSLVVIDGELGLNLATNNPQATSGGSERSSAAPDEQDYENLKQQMLEVLWQNALTDVSAGLNAGDFVIHVKPISVEILDEQYTPAAPAPASILELKMRVEYQILVVREADLTSLAHSILNQNLEEGFSTQPGSLILIPLSEAEFMNENTVHWQVRAQRTVHTTIDAYGLIDSLRGMSPGQATGIIKNQYSLAADPDIELTPAWWPWLPLFPFRIEVNE